MNRKLAYCLFDDNRVNISDSECKVNRKMVYFLIMPFAFPKIGSHSLVMYFKIYHVTIRLGISLPYVISDAIVVNELLLLTA